MVARQRHHPATALIEVDAGARLPSALAPLWEQVCRGPEACTLRRGGVIDVHGAAAAPARASPARPVGGGCLGGALPGAAEGRAQEEVAVR